MEFVLVRHVPPKLSQAVNLIVLLSHKGTELKGAKSLVPFTYIRKNEGNIYLPLPFILKTNEFFYKEILKACFKNSIINLGADNFFYGSSIIT